MITIEESQILMNEFIRLRSIARETKNNEDIIKFRNHEQLCIDKFYYLITMRTDRYRGYSNYDDLNQEGREALVKAMKTYNPEKGNVFWWFHRYIETRIARTANLHTTIRYPLKFAKLNKPHREKIPVLIEKRFCPDKNVEDAEITNAVKLAMVHLKKRQINIINLAFGFDGDKPMSVSKICEKMNVSRVRCVRIINDALGVLKENIKL